MIIKNYKLSHSNYSLLFFNNQKLLSSNLLTYFKIPNEFGINLDNTFLQLFCSDKNLKHNFALFIKSLTLWLKQTIKLYNKKLLLKGLGIRAALSTDLSTLELKLGFSHILLVKIPKKILDVKLLKNAISVSGCCCVSVANFLYRIRSHKMPNAYKGKGLWYKNEIRRVKAVKKT